MVTQMNPTLTPVSRMAGLPRRGNDTHLDAWLKAPGTLATRTRLGAPPVFMRAISLCARASKMDTSWLSVLLTPTNFPSGEALTQFGPSPVGRRWLTFLAWRL